MALEWLLVGAAMGAGGMYLYDLGKKSDKRNPTTPTWDDFERSILISFGREQYFVSLRGKDVSSRWRWDASDWSEALERSMKLAAKHGIDAIYLWDRDDTVTLFDAQGNQLATWENYEAKR